MSESYDQVKADKIVKSVKDKKKQDSVEFIYTKKKQMKDSQYRKRFDKLNKQIKENLVNTEVSYGEKKQEDNGWGSMVVYNKMDNGSYDMNVYPQKNGNSAKSQSGVPSSVEPIAFSKILIATSVLGGKVPDARVESDDKVYSKLIYDLWRRGWSMNGANGKNTLSLVYQTLFTCGWAAWRVYPKRVAVQRKGVEKILFDDVYREPMDPSRTWLGVGFNNADHWSQKEVYYEKDILTEEFFKKYPEANTKENKAKIEYCNSSEEAKDENQDKAKLSVTIGYYEDVLSNRYVICCGKLILYDGELPNDDSHGSIVVVRCFAKDLNDPYGVGLYELMRGNTALFTYINSLNALQVEAEIHPLIFGTQVQNGSNTYVRSPNTINPKSKGTDIDVVQTKGNVQQGIAFGQQQKNAIEENTGINNIVAGTDTESTLGSTVIMKEAAYNRLTPPRNSMVDGLQTDAHIFTSWTQQTLPFDKIFMLDSSESLIEFQKQNPDYYVESEEVIGEDGIPSGGIVAAASKNMRMNFDFTPEGDIQEDVPTRTISARKLFEEVEAYGHKSDYYEFIIDPDSMLLPSMEIQKQTYMALFPAITNQLNIIFAARKEDPALASVQLKTLEQLMIIQKQDIFDYIPKNMYDEIIAAQPVEQPAPPPAPVETLKYQHAPPDVQRQIEEQAGLSPSQMEGVPSQTPGTVAPNKENTPGVSSNKDLITPKGDNQVPRPQSPMGSAVDASMGRAANGQSGFFPGN